MAENTARSLWQNGDRRGAYSRLEHGPSVLLKAAGEAPEAEDVCASFPEAPGQKPVPFTLDGLEIGCCLGIIGGPGLCVGSVRLFRHSVSGACC